MTTYRFVLTAFARPAVPAPPEPESEAASAQSGEAERTGASETQTQAAPVPETPAPVPQEPSAPDLQEAQELVEQLSALIAAAGVSLDALVAGGLLPDTARGEQLDRLRNQLNVARFNPSDLSAAGRAEDTWLSFRQIFDERGTQLAQALVVLSKAGVDADSAAGKAQILERISRYFGQTDLAPALSGDEARWAVMRGSPESIAAFVSAYKKWEAGELEPDPERGKADPEILWKAWRGRVASHLVNASPLSPEPDLYPDLVRAASCGLPSRLFRLPLARMDRLDWSDAALVALPREDGAWEVPRWLLFASLVALGFGARFLHGLQEEEARLRGGAMDGEDAEFVSLLLRAAGDAERAVLEIYSDRPRPKTPVEIDRTQPVLAVGKSVAHHYVYGVTWLHRLGAFIGATDEQ